MDAGSEEGDAPEAEGALPQQPLSVAAAAHALSLARAGAAARAASPVTGAAGPSAELEPARFPTAPRRPQKGQCWACARVLCHSQWYDHFRRVTYIHLGWRGSLKPGAVEEAAERLSVEMVQFGLNPGIVEHLHGFLSPCGQPLCATRIPPARAPPESSTAGGVAQLPAGAGAASAGASELAPGPSGDPSEGGGDAGPPQPHAAKQEPTPAGPVGPEAAPAAAGTPPPGTGTGPYHTDAPGMAAVAECLLKSASGERDDYRCWGCSKKQVKSQWYTHMYRMKAVLGLDPPREKFRELMAQAVVERLGDVAVPLPDDPLTADQRHPFLARLRAALTTDGRLLCDPRDRKPRKRKHAETPASADCPAPQRPFPGAAPPAAATSASAAAVGADGASSGADSGAGKQGPPAAVLAPARQGQARLNSTIAIAVLRSQLEEAKMRQADLRAELEDAETQIDQLSHPPVDVQRMIAQLKAELAAVKAKVAARGYPVNGSESLVDAVEPAGRPSRRRYTPPEELLHAAREDYRKCGFSLRPNRYHVAVVGPSGTGKSALVRGLAKLVCQRSGLPAAPRLPDVPGPGGVRRLTACGVPSSPLTLWDCPSPLSPNVAVYVRQQHLGAFQMQVLVVDRVIEGVHGGLLYALRKEFPTQRMAVVFAKGDSLVADMCRAEPGLTQAQAVSRLRQLALKAARQVTPGSSPLRPDDVFVLSAHSMLAVGEGVPGVQLQLEEERFVAAVLDAMIDDGYQYTSGSMAPAAVDNTALGPEADPATEAVDYAEPERSEEAAESGPGRHGGESLTGLDALAAAAADLLAFGASVGQTDESNADAAGTPQDSDVEARDDPSMAANAGDGCGVRLGGLAWARPVLAELVGPALGPDGGPLGGAWFRAAVGEGPGLLLQVAPEGLRCYGPLERRNGGGGPASNGAQATQAACGSGSGDPPLLRLS